MNWSGCISEVMLMRGGGSIGSDNVCMLFNPQRCLCDIDCSKSLITSGCVRIENIIRSSKLRVDGIYADLEEQSSITTPPPKRHLVHL